MYLITLTLNVSDNCIFNTDGGEDEDDFTDDFSSPSPAVNRCIGNNELRCLLKRHKFKVRLYTCIMFC